MKLTTKRLILRAVTNKDIPDIVGNINNLNVTKWLSVVPYPYNKKDAKIWIKEKIKEERKKKRDSYQFVIELKSEKRVIGGMGIHHIDNFQGKARVGYWLGQKYWRQGYGSEALEALLSFGFKKLKLRRIEAEVLQGNPSSGKLLEKYNFKPEGLKRKATRSKSDGKIRDSIDYGLLKEEYKRR